MRLRRQALHKPHLRHSEALWIQEPLFLHQACYVRGWIGEETPGDSADASEGRLKSREGGVVGGGGVRLG